jgi:antirestriction protein ArdC|tara:strand:+ start:290 stop:1126 length:837 start_codon:yes stop_codon:yes gene_type:complete
MSKRFEKIINLMDSAMESEDSWRKTWKANPRLHCNLVTKHVYTGTNQLTTMISAWQNGYKSPYWLTAKQIINLGGNFKGQTATPAIFYGKGKEKDDPEKQYKFMKVYNLFNLEQTGITLPEPELRSTRLENPYEMGEALQLTTLEDSQYNPSYMPLTDTIKICPPGQFNSDDEHQSAYYHECGHATGHKKRLDRDLTGKFGDEDYAKEEFVAELCAVFLCAELGVTYDLKNHASYLRSWQKAIKSDPKYLFTAATDAKNAFEYCMSQFQLMRKYEKAA